MIALPGLTLATGRFDSARRILLTFARFVDQGLLPNVFPGAGETPDYNTVDAGLWYFEAWRAYLEASGDWPVLAEVFPVLADMIDWHVRELVIASAWMRPTACCMPANPACSSPGWTPRWATGW